MMPISAPEDVGALWLLTLQRAVGRASHDVKDALNGVSVNLEVIRSRAARPNAPASVVAQFGDAAGQQLERLTTLIEAVLALARADRTPADVGVTLRRVVAICGASASSADAAVLLVDDGMMGWAQTRVHGDVVRLALMAPLLDMATGTDRAERLSAVTCTLAGDDEVVQVLITAEGRRATMPDGVAHILRSAGVRCTEGHDLSLAFPRA
jgi:signal transduction histidine kinase